VVEKEEEEEEVVRIGQIGLAMGEVGFLDDIVAVSG